ncbi:MAG TPA: FkbM family methyltransferase [Dokdonella sp.]|uniref:FkbM family methyltransferase n=1 Tax=Dokdonella sp. TaxID=2291710 RepID=UPI002BD8E569|nr:FkbM family methyltransferase [Dokdonella sp.]HUD41831.1 FkbM family methyltransferase [Dokdonella sp.]
MTKLSANAEDIRYAYRLILGREPDQSGFEHYKNNVLTAGVDPPKLARYLLESEEYKNKNREVSELKEIDFNGIKLFPWIGDDLIGGNIINSGSYEPHVLPRFLECLKPGFVVLDVGANIGTFSLTAAKAVGTAGRVVSVEPVAKNVRSICAGVVGNGFENVTILPVAASDRSRVVPILRHADSSNGIVDVHAPASVADAYVPALRLDETLAYLDRLDVLKIDIEGHEPMAWPGIAGLVSRHRPMVFSELNPVAIRNHSHVEADRYLELLFAHTDVITVLHLDGRVARCKSMQEVMREWREVNRQKGLNGEYLVDLMFKAER